MRTIKGLITGLFTIFSYSFCYSQQVEATPAQWLVEHKQEINSMAYIFEGTVLQQKNFQWRDRLLECNVIQIARIYKGSPQIKLGTIKVIQWNGGIVSGNAYSYASDYIGITLNKGQTYVIFGNPAYTNVLDSLITDNQTNLTAGDEPVVFVGNDSARWFGTPQFKTKEDIYSFFKKNGLTVEEEVAQPADSTK